MTDIAKLLERVRAATGPDNALDVEIEIATFRPDAFYASVRANSAGTKLIYITRTGHNQTCLAWDWTLNDITRSKAIAALSALSSGDAS